MKQKTADRIARVSLLAGTALCCAYNHVLAAVILLVSFVCICAVLWVRMIADLLADAADEDADRLAEEMFQEMCETAEYHIHSDQYILCGKGYKSQEDTITMIRATTLRPGGLYVHLSGDVYKCLRTTADGCAVLMDINSGTLLTVRGVYEYQDGKISYERCVESIRIGA